MLKRLLFALAILASSFLAWYFQSIQPVTRLSLPNADFEVKSGAGVDQIANELSSARLIRSRIGFKITVLRLGIANRIQAGYFKLSPSMGAVEIAEALTKAYARQVRVTIPEGLRAEEISDLLQKNFGKIDGGRYSSADFLIQSDKLNGQYFPDTYDFSPQSTAKEISDRLINRFEQVVTDLGITSQQLPQILTVASLLEREAANNQEMPLIAGVIHNRLRINMPLQIDATVQYAIGSSRCLRKPSCDWWPQTLTRENLKFNSPYNTYLYPGLPPFPISNPGRDALAAALHPATTTALYYLHDDNGQIHLGNTLKEHNQNICTYLKKDCQ